MVLFGYSVVFVGRTSSLQGGEPVCHDCLVLNGTIKLNSMFARLGTDYEIRNQWFFAILEAVTTDLDLS